MTSLPNKTLRIPKHLGYLYTFNFDYHYAELCKLESRQVFGKELENKLVLSDIRVDPSISPFIKNRIEILAVSESYTDLVQDIKKMQMQFNDFIVEYLPLFGDEIDQHEKRKKLIEIGYCIEGEPNFKNPSTTYILCKYHNIWYFGLVERHQNSWRIHKHKPCSFSNSIGMTVAKSLVSISSKGNTSHKLLDACCGVGTIMLEACIAGFDIEGCDINMNSCEFTKQNLNHFNYTATIHHSDINALNQQQYDAAIIDLPYNIYSYSTDSITENIIASTAKLTNRVVIVSTSDIEEPIKKSGLSIIDYCTVVKRGKSNFTRKIWVCEKEEGPTSEEPRVL